MIHPLFRRPLAVCCALACMAVAACSDTTIVPYPEEAQSKILRYTIVNSPEPIPAAVNQANKTITVYLPAGVYLTLLEPEIEISEGATITPESGTFVEDMVDYFASGRDITYTVSGADGTTATYTLTVVSQQTPLAFQEVSDADAPNSYNHANSWYDTNNNYFVLTPSVPFQFDLLSVARVYLVGEDNKTYECKSVYGSGNLTVVLNGIEGYAYGKTDSPPAGLYHIQVQYYSSFNTLENPIEIRYQ